MIRPAPHPISMTRICFGIFALADVHHVGEDLLGDGLFARGKELFVRPVILESGDVVSGILLRPGIPVAPHFFQLLFKVISRVFQWRNSHCNAIADRAAVLNWRCIEPRGRLAQLGERCVRNAEVGGSIPPPSTNFLLLPWDFSPWSFPTQISSGTSSKARSGSARNCLPINLAVAQCDFRLGSEFNVFEHSRYPYIDLKSKTALEGIMRTVNVEPGEPFILQPREFVLAITEENAGTRCGRPGPSGRAVKSWAYRDHRAWHRRSLRSGLERKGHSGTQQSGPNARCLVPRDADLFVYFRAVVESVGRALSNEAQ